MAIDGCVQLVVPIYVRDDAILQYQFDVIMA